MFYTVAEKLKGQKVCISSLKYQTPAQVMTDEWVWP